MRIPHHKPKPGEPAPEPVDVHITQKTYDQLARKRERLLKRVRPRLADEVKRLAEMGDFSENAAYQIAKGRLRGINRAIDELEYRLNHAIIIQPANNHTVQLGSTVTVAVGGREKTYRILGATEADPDNNIISHASPLGQALLGKRVGETAVLRREERAVHYDIRAIA